MSNTDFTGPLPIITPRQPQPRATGSEFARLQRTITRAQRVLIEFSEDGQRTAEETIGLLVDILREQKGRDERAMPPPRRRTFDWR